MRDARGVNNKRRVIFQEKNIFFKEHGVMGGNSYSLISVSLEVAEN